LQPALISQEAQQELQRRYGFGSWPALVSLRCGEYLGVIAQVQNWEHYLREIDRLPDSDSVKAPGFTIPVVSEAAHSCR